MKICIRCRKYRVTSPKHDLCIRCWHKLKESDMEFSPEDHFEDDLVYKEIHTVYIMFYQRKEKIGYTKDLKSRLIEIKRKYPGNKLVYFREFSTESEARRFELWLKKLTKRELNKFISDFQDKIRRVENLF